jgi:hypothetical protein
MQRLNNMGIEGLFGASRDDDEGFIFIDPQEGPPVGI